MDPNNNPLERILDIAHSQHNLHSLINLQNSHPLDSYPLFLNINDSKNYQKYDFLPMSPNPFKHQRKNSSDLVYQFKNHYSSNQHPINRKLLFEQDQHFSKWNFIDKESQFLFNTENAYMFKKTDAFQFSMKQKIQPQEKKMPSFLEFKLSKNQRGLKSLSEIIYEMLKKNDNLTLNTVAQQLVEKFRMKCLEQDSVLQQSAQKNIRRRTYDALNVLISAGIVKKIGKSISLIKKGDINIGQNTTTPNRIRQVTKREVILQQLKDQLQQRITRREMILRKKRQQYENLLQRRRNIQRFFEAKKWEEMQGNGESKGQYKEKEGDLKQKQRIDFPFLCIKTIGGNLMGVSESSNRDGNKRVYAWQKDNSSTCDLYNKQEGRTVTLHFSSKDIFQSIALEGDVDFISNLGSMIVAGNITKDELID